MGAGGGQGGDRRGISSQKVSEVLTKMSWEQVYSILGGQMRVKKSQVSCPEFVVGLCRGVVLSLGGLVP